MKIFSYAPLLCLVFLPLLAAGAPITWGVATDVSTSQDVSVAGFLVEAFNAGENGVADRTVNGVLFTGTGAILPMDTDIDVFSGDTGDAAYNTLLGNVDFGGGGDLFTLDLSGLPEGYGFPFEFRIDSTVVADVSPIMDRVVMDFHLREGTVMRIR